MQIFAHAILVPEKKFAMDHFMDPPILDRLGNNTENHCQKLLHYFLALELSSKEMCAVWAEEALNYSSLESGFWLPPSLS